MIEDWGAPSFSAELRGRERALILYYASWCPFSRMFLPIFQEHEPEANVPFARADLKHPMDPRWDDHRVLTVPTLVYYEHGEELERLDGARGRGITRAEFERFLSDIDAIQEEPRLPRRMHGARRS